ncbi:Myb-like DNA-binding domain-containing protein [Spironucleus salmonicida]|uniref:Myb-like DNA-binding domain-containing protein n=1 Tax=Spironucleus salmonicida TaxID=348837 RepID=V6LQ23_9EUKA|nr:Myb-like DNA-binding domain-containing protein [Spironucleus salmonicida]KAH0571644.1 Myb-like DNA-binding domain-containing protein [Spironucleus salmonicida]|eukprot:EST45410.1 Myb-like DNA-binding domain-containing protein [Spironucleus salmonicida]
MPGRIKWTYEQEERLQQAYKEYRGRWETIRERSFRGHTVSQLKNKYYKIARNDPSDEVVIRESPSLSDITLNDILALVRLIDE